MMTSIEPEKSHFQTPFQKSISVCFSCFFFCKIEMSTNDTFSEDFYLAVLYGLLFRLCMCDYLFIFHISKSPISLKEGLWQVYNMMDK